MLHFYQFKLRGPNSKDENVTNTRREQININLRLKMTNFPHNSGQVKPHVKAGCP